MELHEVTICEKGINPEAQFRILKEDTTGETMTNTMSELQSVLERLSKKLDDKDEGQKDKESKNAGMDDIADIDGDGDRKEPLMEAKKDKKENG